MKSINIPKSIKEELMKTGFNKLFFALFALFVIFNDELFYAFMYVTKIQLMSGMKGRLAMVTAAVAYLLMLYDMVTRRFSQRNFWQIVALSMILVLYLFTGLLYPHGWEYHYYVAHLLAYGGLSIPAAYVGMRLARGGYERSMLICLPYYLIVVAIVVGMATLTGFSENRILGWSADDNGMNYQSSSYFMSFCFAYSAFYVFFLNDMKKNAWQKMISLAVVPLVFLCAVGTIVGGGRGAFVNLLVATAFIVFRVFQRSTGKMGIKYIIMLAGAITVMIYLAVHYGIFDSAGALRVAGSLTVDEGRAELRRLALVSFGKSPLIGHGVGSIWWEVGFYSHNLIADILCETGFLGALVIIVTLAIIFFRLARGSKVNSLDFFLLLIYMGHMVHDMFSGYWISSPALFLVYGYVYGKPKILKWDYQLH